MNEWVVFAGHWLAILYFSFLATETARDEIGEFQDMTKREEREIG